MWRPLHPLRGADRFCARRPGRPIPATGFRPERSHDCEGDYTFRLAAAEADDAWQLIELMQDGRCLLYRGYRFVVGRMPCALR